MATNAIGHNTIHRTARCIGHRVVIVVVAASLASVVHAESTPLLANPSGSLSIDPLAPVSIASPDAKMTPVGPSAEAPVHVAEALEISQGNPQTGADPDKPASFEASKPLGAAAESVIGDTDSNLTNDTSQSGWWVRTALALAGVIGLILLCKFALTRVASRGGGSLAAQLGPAGRAPSGLLSVLARYPIAKGSTLVLLRLDRRVLLLSQTGQGFTTLAEIDDPEEVAALIMRAEDEEGASLTRRFRTMLTQAERDPGLIGEREFEIEPVVPMTPKAATARFNELAMDPGVVPALRSVDHDDDHTDAVGSLRNRLRSLREVTA